MRSAKLRGVVLAALVQSACGSSKNSTANSSQDPGALVAVAINSTVGVLLDEIPQTLRDRAAQDLLAKPTTFWSARANRQLKLTAYRLVFRQGFYAKMKYMGKDALPLPPDSIWNITFNGPARRGTTQDGHDYVMIDYSMNSTILTDANSPGQSEPALANGSGKWAETFTLPLDPELVFQRTRFACLDEAQFPPQSVDSEEVDSFYDDSCGVEKTLTQTGCHQTELPTMSCTQALTAKIGSITTNLNYTRLTWDPNLANSVRVGPLTNMSGSNLTPEQWEFRINRIIYRYIPPNDCSLVEQCVGGSGWRRLMQFSTADRNTGTTPLNIGAIDYFNALDGGGTALSQHNVFEWSACHHHYHFTHYGSFSFNNDQGLTHKRGFCLQATDRFSNIEQSPLPNPYANCWFQGIMAGWVDEYKAGLPCQWIDVTSVDTSKKPVTGPLTFVSNPDGFLCEGTPILDSSGNQEWVPTSFLSSTGQPVDKPACNYYSTPTDPNAWLSDNTDTYNTTVPSPGNGYVTTACTHDEIGPLRNCSFSSQSSGTCTPGAQTTVHCTLPAGSAAQVARVCDYSIALATGIPCTYQDSLANTNIDPAGTDVTFTCPSGRDATEVGGHYSVYATALFNDDAPQPVSCR
jgi:hypothetical protein